MLNNSPYPVESIIASLDNDFNIDNADYIPRVAAWCIACMSELNVMPTAIFTVTSPVKGGKLLAPDNVAPERVRIFDANGNEFYYVKHPEYKRLRPNKSFVVNENNVIELSDDRIDSVTVKYQGIKRYFSEAFNCDLPVIPNNGKLIEVLLFYCMYKILARGIKHPVYSLSNQAATNPYLIYKSLKDKAIASIIIDQQHNDAYGNGWDASFYNATFKPRSND